MLIQQHLDLASLTDDILGLHRAIGVDYIAIMHPPSPRPSDDGEVWHRAQRKVQSHRMKLYNIGLRPDPQIIHARAERDLHVEGWRNLIRNMGAAGIPTLGYNFRGIGNFRTESAVGRGDARYSTFDYGEFQADPPSHPDLQIGEEKLRENLRYFVEAIVPVAEEAGVVLTMHPDDPPRPEPLAGAARVLSPLDDFEHLFDAVPSPSNAMLFCQGCVAEMDQDIPTAIRRIAAHGKIGTVHFRNIRGSSRRFEEFFIDEGDHDMLLAMQTYRDVGFAGPFMMDHTPGLQQPDARFVGLALVVGYMRALIQAVYR